MRYGEMFANFAALLLLATIVFGFFFLFGELLWPPRYASMVLLPRVDAMTTASTRKTCDPAPCLPESFDSNMLASRPEDGP
jgi:hypothetical protein